MAPRTWRTSGEVEAHAYMHAKGVPQLLDSVLKELLVERPDDAVGLMREILRKTSSGLDGGGIEDGKERSGHQKACTFEKKLVGQAKLVGVTLVPTHWVTLRRVRRVLSTKSRGGK